MKRLRPPAPGAFQVYRVLFCLMPLFGGLLFSEAWIAGCAVNFCFLIWQCYQKKTLLWQSEARIWVCSAAIALGAMINVFTGVDQGGALEGLGWLFSIGVFNTLLEQWPAEERQKLLRQLPAMGTGMVILCLLAWPLPQLSGYLFENRRMAGPFQYANTFAVFLLICLIVHHSMGQKHMADRLMDVVLLAGLLGTASRTTALLLAAWLLYLGLHRQLDRCAILGLAGSAAGIAALAASGHLPLVLERVMAEDPFTTLYGRLLYWKDACRVLWQHPLGIGRQGWLYLQGMVQTGVYNVRFVHNDFLQFALDYGIVPAVIALAWVIAQFKKGPLAKPAAVILLLHSFFEWDMQYQFIVFVLLLLLSPYTYPNREKTPMLGLFAVPGCLVLLLLPIGLANVLSSLGQYESAHRIYPFDTDISVRRMLEQPTLPQAAAAARDILELDPYEATSWQILAEAAAENAQYDVAMDAMRQAVILNKYDQQRYDDAFEMCKKALANGIPVQDVSYQLSWLANKMERTRAETDPLGYKLPESPDLELSNETALTIRILEQITASDQNQRP